MSAGSTKLLAFLVVAAAIGAAFYAWCSKTQGPGEAGGPYPSGVHGLVEIDPRCPSVMSAGARFCNQKPYRTTVAVFKTNDLVYPVASGESGPDGAFSFSLPPGDYILGAGGSDGPQCDHPQVTVPASDYYVQQSITCVIDTSEMSL